MVLPVNLEESLPDTDLEAMREGMRRHTAQFTEVLTYGKVTATVRAASGALMGALLGETGRGLMYVDLLWVHEDHRGDGHGSRLLETAEAEARTRGCHTAYLFTFDYQAPKFYEQHGYEVFGTLEGFSGDHSRFYMKKSLGRDSSTPTT